MDLYVQNSTVLESQLEVWFICEYCNRAFLRPKKLFEHKRDSHKEQFYKDKGIQSPYKKRKYTLRGNSCEQESSEENKNPSDGQGVESGDDHERSPMLRELCGHTGVGSNLSGTESVDRKSKTRSQTEKDLANKFTAKFQQAVEKASSTLSSKKFKCRSCSSTFKSLTLLDMHALIFHNQRNQAKYSCKHCGKTNYVESFHLIHEKNCSEKKHS